MAVKTVRDILVAAVAASPATALAAVGARISPNIRAQNETLPCVVLTGVSVVPQSVLNGAPTLDANRVQLDVYAETFAQANAIAAACRTALEAGDCVLDNEFEGFEPDVSEYRVTQDWLVWT